MNLLLASASPRRAELLQRAGVAFEVFPAEIDESVGAREEPDALVRRLSVEKARAVLERHPGRIILAADTVVEHDGKILGKPQDESQALEMLSALSGDCHEVMTGFTLLAPDQPAYSQVVTTEVEFRELSEEDLRAYLATGDPMDKAGAYGIQSGATGFVKAIRGSYTNVVGLPLAEVVMALRSI